MPQSNELDSTAKKTLNALGTAIRTEKFVLRAIIKQKKQFESKEIESREKIRNLTDRIRWELDYHIALNSKNQSDDSGNKLED